MNISAFFFHSEKLNFHEILIVSGNKHINITPEEIRLEINIYSIPNPFISDKINIANNINSNIYNSN